MTGEDVTIFCYSGVYWEFSSVCLSTVHLFQAAGRFPCSTSPRRKETPDALPAQKTTL